MNETGMTDEDTKAAYAPCWMRTASMVVDAVLLMAMLALLQQFIADVQLQYVIYQVGGVAYFILLESSRRQASLGKSLLKIHVAMADGRRAAFSRLLVRYIIWTFFGLPFIALTMSADYAHLIKTVQHLMVHGGNDAAVSYMKNGEGRELIRKLWICFFIYAIPGIALFWLPMIFTREKTGLHDFMTRTRVYKERHSSL